jgi:hypothetical protein
MTLLFNVIHNFLKYFAGNCEKTVYKFAISMSMLIFERAFKKPFYFIVHTLKELQIEVNYFLIKHTLYVLSLT